MLLQNHKKFNYIWAKQFITIFFKKLVGEFSVNFYFEKRNLHQNIYSYLYFLVSQMHHSLVENFLSIYEWRCSTCAHITLGVRAQKNLGPNLSIFGCLFGIKLLINATTFDVGILLNAGTLAPSIANWLPKFDGILFFQPIGGHLLVTWGRLKIFFYFGPWDSSCKALGANFNFCSNKNA